MLVSHTEESSEVCSDSDQTLGDDDPATSETSEEERSESGADTVVGRDPILSSDNDAERTPTYQDSLQPCDTRNSHEGHQLESIKRVFKNLRSLSHRIRSLDQYCEALEQMLDDGDKITLRDVSSRLLRDDDHRRLVFTAYRATNSEEFRNILSIITDERRQISIPNTARDQRFIGFAIHNLKGWEHIHVLHSCPWNNYSCRCGIPVALRRWKLPCGSAKPLSSLSAEDIELITFYHLANGKYQLYSTLSRKYGRICCEDGGVQMERREISAGQGLVEDCCPPQPSHGKRKRRSHTNGDGPNSRTATAVGGSEQQLPEEVSLSRDIWRNASSPGQSPFSKRIKFPIWQSLVTHFKRYPHCPTESIVHTEDWFKCPATVEINPQRDVFDLAVRQYRMSINKLNLQQLFQVQTAPDVQPVYSAPGSDQRDNY